MNVQFWKPETLVELKPQMNVVIGMIRQYEPNDADRIAWVTSVTRPKDHGSLHRHGHALDFDTTDTEENKDLTAYLMKNLPLEFDVLLEDEGEENEHIHVEFDPTR